MSTNNKKQKPWKVKSEKKANSFFSSKQNNKTTKKKSGKNSFGKKLRSAIFVVLGILLVTGLCGAGYLYYMISKQPEQNNDNTHITENQDMFENNESQDKNDDSGKISRKEGFYNILVIGRDKVALNTDVIIAASFDTKAGKAATVQIPRDSYVSDDAGNKSKINAVFARGYTDSRSELARLKNAAKGKSESELAALCESSSLDIDADTLSRFINGKITQDKLCTKYGIKKLQNVIGSTFGIYFDYYAIVSTDAFVKIVDAIGGVDVYVQEDMYYHDPLQNLHIDIKAGQRHLDGKQAEGFVRYRSGYVQADIARLDAQKIFLTAFFKKALSLSTLGRVDEVVKAAFECVDTDMTVENALGFVKPALSLDLSNITMMNMLGYAYNGGMYYSLDKKANLAIVNEHFNIFDRDLSESAVNVIELVTPSSSGETGGMTMEDISEHQPSLDFIHQVPQTPEPAIPVVSDPSVTTPSEDEVTEDIASDTPDSTESDSTDTPDASGDTVETPTDAPDDTPDAPSEEETPDDTTEDINTESAPEDGEEVPPSDENSTELPDDMTRDETPDNTEETQTPSVTDTDTQENVESVSAPEDTSAEKPSDEV